MKQINQKKINFLKVKSDLGARIYGASLGIDAVHIASIQQDINIFESNPITEVDCPLAWIADENEFPFAKKIDYVYDLFEIIIAKMQEILDKKEFPFILAGAHTSAAATIMALQSYFPNKRMGVIWIDAHADMHNPYTTPSGNLHGMPLAMVMDVDHSHLHINELSDEEFLNWTSVCNMGGRIKINPKDLVFLGIRDLESQEWDLVNGNNIKYFSVKEVRDKGSKLINEEIEDYLKDCDYIYVSFDVDSMDPQISKGTGTPVDNGFFEKEIIEILSLLKNNPKLAALEIVEINPLLDDSNKMALSVSKIMNQVLKA